MKSLALRIALAIVIIPFGTYAAQGPGAGQHAPKPPLAVERSETLTPFPGLDMMLAPDWGAPLPDKPTTNDQALKERGVAFDPANGHGVGGGDMPEIEPNDYFNVANVASDMPFDCTGSISYVGDFDFMSVNFTAGQPIQIDVFHRFGYLNTPLDPFLYVVAENQSTIVAYNDDLSFPSNLNSQVRFIAPYTGTYYLIIKSAVSAGGPNYGYVVSAWACNNDVFSVSNLEVEPNNTPSYADVITTPGVKIGAMQSPGDADYTVFYALAGTTIVADVHSQIYLLPMDPVIELYDAYGTRLFANDDMDSRDPRFNILIPESGNYYLKVSDYTNAGGMGYIYILSVSAQFGTGSPVVSTLKYNPNGLLKKVVGSSFGGTGSIVEVNALPISSVASAVKPTTVIKVKPNLALPDNAVVTVRNPDGRRSNPFH